jgi:cobalt-zinc-cadmium efflux system protein
LIGAGEHPEHESAEPTAADGESHAGHAGDGHTHAGVTEDTDRRRLAIALALIVMFMAVEVAVGLVAHSLVLLSDAAHMLTDAGALALSLVALRLASRPARGAMTFGLKRAEILSAQANGATLLVLGGLIVFEGIRRLINPPGIDGWAVVITALAGIVVNLLATWQLAKANRDNMAIEGSFQHIITDLYAFIGTAIAGAVILFTGFDRADPIASLLVAALMFRAAYGLLKDSGRVLLEAAPEGLDIDEVGRVLASHPHVTNVHDLHVWEIGTGFPALSAHVLVHEGDDCHEIRRELERILDDRFSIDHTTLQVDHASDGDALLPIGRPGSISVRRRR